MPVEQRVGTRERIHRERLSERLFQEWQAQQAGDGEPLIIEEAPRQGEPPNHLYVVWSDWDDLTPIERSRTILQAYERYHGHALASEVTLAMGLTPKEAEQMGIRYEAEAAA